VKLEIDIHTMTTTMANQSGLRPLIFEVFDLASENMPSLSN
jgi:hypothetical protein